MDDPTRRRALRTLALCCASFGLLDSTGAWATRNNEGRQALKYQDHPDGKKHCSLCMHYRLGATPERGGCEYLLGDDEISVNGYCPLWSLPE